MRHKLLLPMLALVLGLLLHLTAQAAESRYTTQDGTELSYQELKADSEVLYLLFPAEFGFDQANIRLGRLMQEGGLHTWVLDLFSPYFLPISTASMDEIPAADIAGLIRYAHKQSGKPVVLVAYGRGAIPALRAGREWLKQPVGDKGLKGLILLHPKLYVGTPSPGEAQQYMPIVAANQMPVYLLSPTQSPSRWRIDEDAAQLQGQGAPVFIELLKGLRNFYFNNPHPSDYELKMRKQLPATLKKAATLLARTQPAHRQSVAQLKGEQSREAPKIRGIEPYKGDPTPPELAFEDTRGRMHRLSDYRGKVVLLNFWATWCPPCVHEMPSMDRLQKDLGEDHFAILAVNMAEEQKVVETFLERDVKVSFPVLLDSKGLALKDWDVFVYPTTYIIDKAGKIRSAMYGAIDWDTPKIRAQMKALMEE